MKTIDEMYVFINENDPSAELNRLSILNEDVNEKWKAVKESFKRYNIKSIEEIKRLVTFYENAVKSSYSDDFITREIYYKSDVLIAKYKALQGIEILCNSLGTIPVCRSPEFRSVSMEDVDELIKRMEGVGENSKKC